MAGTFAIDVSKFGEKAVRNSRQAVRWIVLELLRKVVMKSPVGNPDNWEKKPTPGSGYVGGRFRGNWQTTVGGPASGEVGLRDEGVAPRTAPRSIRTVGEGFLALASFDGDGSVFLTNNLPYAERLEEGHSRTQAPHGIVDVTLVEFPGVVRRQAERARRSR